MVPVPPVARSLMCSALMPTSLQRAATSCAASIAAYGEDSSRSALTFIPPEAHNIIRHKEWGRKGRGRGAPVTREMVSLPERSVTCTKVSLNEA